jgi:DNA-binding CsgD family transcriptional regulator
MRPVLTGAALHNLTDAVISACRCGLAPEALRAEVLPRLRQVVPVDALWWAAVDPATLLFTQAFREGLPAESGAYFIANEFLHKDVNKWTDLARQPAAVATLMGVTGGEPTRSQRYTDIFAPLGLQDELRAVLRVRGHSWGYLCLHREGRTAFSPEEARFVQLLAPHLGEGIRMGLLRQACTLEDPADGPGLVLLGADGTLAGMNEAAGRWLEELGARADGSNLPVEITTVALRLRHLRPDEPALPRLRVRTRSGRWASLHASWMSADTAGVLAIIIDVADPADVASVIMLAHGLTDRETTITELVCRGLSTKQMTTILHLSGDTIQDHLKAVFAKTGTRSRGELAATILQRDYLPRSTARDRIGKSGAYPATNHLEPSPQHPTPPTNPTPRQAAGSSPTRPRRRGTPPRP